MARIRETLTVLISLLFITLPCKPVQSKSHALLGKEKVSHLHFFLHDTVRGDHPTAVAVARPNITGWDLASFGTVFAMNDPLTEGPEIDSKVVGNAQGLYVSSGRDKISLFLAIDFGFTKGKFKGSSFSVLSRNPVLETERELPIVGGRGKFRLARGYAELKTYYFNITTGDAVVEYHVTLIHYE